MYCFLSNPGAKMSSLFGLLPNALVIGSHALPVSLIFCLKWPLLWIQLWLGSESVPVEDKKSLSYFRVLKLTWTTTWVLGMPAGADAGGAEGGRWRSTTPTGPGRARVALPSCPPASRCGCAADAATAEEEQAGCGAGVNKRLTGLSFLSTKGVCYIWAIFFWKFIY